MMSFADVVRTSLGNLTRHKARTLLTTVGVIVGILTIVTMVSLGIGVQQEMRSAFDSVGLEALRIFPVTEEADSFDLFGQPKRIKLLTPELVSSLQARNDVVEVVPFLRLPSGVGMTVRLNSKETQAVPWGPIPGSVPEPFELGPPTLAGEELPPAQGGGATVSQSLLTRLGFDGDDLSALLGQPIEVILHAPRGESETFVLQITGITDDERSSLALALPDRMAMLEWWYNDPKYLTHQGFDQVFIRAKSLSDAANIVNWLDTEGYRVQSLKMMLDMANRGMVILQTMLGSVGGLALFVASIGIANTMIMAVYERTKEIGILKAVGAAPGQIRTLFVVEASLIGLLGGVVGTILGWLLGKGLNRLILEIMHWQQVNVEGTFFVVSWWLIAAALVFATLVGLLAGLYPAARAAHLAPLEALRYE